MIKVLKAGIYSTIQDKGRIGFAAFGVPVSGVMDTYSADIANSILNNSLEKAVIEITFGGCAFQFLCDTFICISGGDFSAEINQQKININKKIKIFKNDILSFGKVNYGVRSYLAVSGGIQSEKILKSRSFYKGITNDYILKRGMEVSILENKEDLKMSNSSIKIDELHFSSEEIICKKGPEYDLLDIDQQEKLLSKIFSVSNDNNRMGYRLKERLQNSLPSILTSAVLPGTVQLTPSGNLIVLMRDCQITGGYPRILQVSENSINKMAHKTTHQSFKFKL